MLSHLHLSNFRHFDNEIHVRFRPITILIGRNSSGKSTALKFLLMLKQSIGSTSTNFPLINGELVRLGSFSDIKNVNSKKNSLEFAFSFQPSRLDFIEFAPNVQVERTRIDTSKLRVSMQGKISYFNNIRDGELVYSVGEETDPSKYFDFSTPVKNDKLLYLDSLRSRIRETTKLFREYSKSRPAGSSPYTTVMFEKLTEELIENEIGVSIQEEFGSMTHLPPIRGELSRLVDFSETTKDSTEQKRQDTLVQLRNIMHENAGSLEFLSKHLLDVTAIKSIGIKDDPLERGQVTATNNDTDAEVLIADFGFGVSQFLPVLVEGITMSSGECLMVEQPEAQLHPTAQLHLGSFFAELWTDRGVKSVIETHSQNLLLRIRRLIARDDLSPEDVSVAFFTFDQEQGNAPIVKNLDIYEDGSMEPGLPMEFFAEDIREGLKLGARK